MPTTQTDAPSHVLHDRLGPRIAGDLHTGEMMRALYATDASMYAVEPLGVLIPKTKSDVQAALEIAHEHAFPVLPRGGGSSLAGQGVNEALVVDFSNHLNRILEIDPAAQTARVEPGVTLSEVNRAAAEHGLMVGPDPASGNRATLGGMLANSSTAEGSVSSTVVTARSASLRDAKWTTPRPVVAGFSTRSNVSSVVTASVPSLPQSNFARLGASSSSVSSR